MKNVFYALTLVSLSVSNLSAQDNNTIEFEKLDAKLKWPEHRENDSTRIFSLSPIHSRVKTVSGLALGVGHFESHKIDCQTVNGLNLEASPISLLLATFAINVPFEAVVSGIDGDYLTGAAFLEEETKPYIKVNGLNLSSGGFMGGAEMSGLNICVFTGINIMSGVSISGAVQGVHDFKGVCIAGLANLTENGNGMQIGVSNVSRNHKGVQLGLFNHSRNLRGFQFGLWNTNGKRKLPLVNWQFKKQA